MPPRGPIGEEKVGHMMERAERLARARNSNRIRRSEFDGLMTSAGWSESDKRAGLTQAKKARLLIQVGRFIIVNTLPIPCSPETETVSLP